ncbi:MAG: response regulator [Lentisphaerota bacterium]
MEQKSVLIVENDGILALHLSHMLTDLGYSVLRPVAEGETAIALAAAERPDLILMDIQLAGEMDGITTAGHIRASVDVPVVFLTSFANSSLLKRASAVSPYGYLLKPESPRELAATIEMAFHKHTFDQQLKEHKEALQKANDELERRVAARTEALQRANEELQSEITARKRTEETLQVLSSRLLVSQEEEQRRIAMELHDQTGQDLSVLKLQMASLQGRLRKDQANLKDDFKKALTFIDGVMEDVRRLAHGLCPSQLQILGLCAALQAMIRNFSEKTRISVQFCVDALDKVFPDDTQIVLYRIFQEALTNIYKHSGAKSVNIDTSRKGDALCI